MKKITLFFALATFLSLSSRAQINISVDATETWNGYVNAFDLSDNFATGFGYDIASLRTDVDPVGQTVTVFPNFKIWDDNDDTPGTGEFDAEWNPYWFSSPGVPAKKVELNSYVQKDRTNDPDFFTQDVIFSGNINSFGLNKPLFLYMKRSIICCR